MPVIENHLLELEEIWHKNNIRNKQLVLKEIEI